MHLNTISDCILAMRFAAELGSCVVLEFFCCYFGSFCVCCGFALVWGFLGGGVGVCLFVGVFFVVGWFNFMFLYF